MALRAVQDGQWRNPEGAAAIIFFVQNKCAVQKHLSELSGSLQSSYTPLIIHFIASIGTGDFYTYTCTYAYGIYNCSFFERSL